MAPEGLGWGAAVAPVVGGAGFEGALGAHLGWGGPGAMVPLHCGVLPTG